MVLQPPCFSLFRNPGGSSLEPRWEGSRFDNEFAAKKVEDSDGDGRRRRDDEERVSTEGFVGNGLFDSCCQSNDRKKLPSHDKGWPKTPLPTFR